jgi:exosome complex component CSL4
MTLEIYDRTKDSEKLVLPGTRLAVTEEFIGRSGTYSEGNFVYAAVTGKVVIDLERHEISVLSKPVSASVPKVGDIVLGSIVNVSRQMASVSVSYINNRIVQPSYTMVMHVSQLSKEYLETAEDAVRLADIVRAKVIDAKTIPLQGTLIGSQLGVVLASCSQCGYRLEKIGRNKLKCKSCSYIERRATTIDYGSSELGFKK